MIELKTPKLGSIMTSAFIADWKKNVGDRVSENEVVVTIETDKITEDVVSPVNGVIRNIFAEEGDEKEIGEVLCVIDED